MANTSITRRDLQDDKRSWRVATGSPHVFQFEKPTLDVLELEDVHFHHNSAVLLPDQHVAHDGAVDASQGHGEGAGAGEGGESGESPGGAESSDQKKATWTSLGMVASCLRHAENMPDRCLLIAGHTDTSGDKSYNLPLSRLRAHAVHAVLVGDRDEWLHVCDEKSKVEDYQQILKWVSHAWGWPCDPGNVDDQSGPKTEAAVKAFQQSYNLWEDDSKKAESIPENGKVGPETWGAFFDLYMDALEQILGLETEDEMKELRASIHWLDSARPLVGCGESFPVDHAEQDNYRSETNRRVEMIFFPPDHEPALPLACHPTEEKCEKSKCAIYWKYRRGVLPPKPQPKPGPPCSVQLTSLSRWFLPGMESCDIGYKLSGSAQYANQLVLEVLASNYCELDQWNDGLPKWKPLADTPVYTRAMSDEYEAEGAAMTISDWKGETNCSKGILARGADDVARVVNVACSPYTVHLRYFKRDADEKARLELKPFWPTFDDKKEPVAASLKVQWTVVGTRRLTQGRLEIWDRDGKAVFQHDLKKEDVTEGDHSFDWDGATTSSGKAAPEHMPYRVHLTAQSPGGGAGGLGLAVAQTEVRLFVHPDTLAADKDPYEVAKDFKSLDLGVADLYHKDDDPDPDKDGTVWTKFALAGAGFHPGPVNDANANPHYTTALGEFQRSVPKNGAAPFQRLTLSGSDDDDSKKALKSLEAKRKRPWFGKDADRSDYDPASEDFLKTLRDPTQSIIVWVDDRHWYTDPAWLQPPNDDVTPTIRSLVTGHATAVGNQRGPYTWGDPRVTQDEKDIARPWVPIQTDFRVLKKAEQLTDKPAAKLSDEDLAATRAAIGPLRVDWSFDEIDGDTIAVPAVDRTQYHKERGRTRAALEWALDNLKTANYERKDVKRKATYFNCPTDNDGIRPKDGKDYYKAPFGLDAERLMPWKPADATDRETILTVVHDRLGQPAEDVSGKRRLGRAGVYFHPSRMGGDGYRLRAQVWFAKHADYDLPNLAALAARYPRSPQAHSAAIRLWRKTSIRGYLRWGSPATSWPGTRAGMLTQHAACHMHIVNEIDVSDGDVAVPLANIWSNAEVATFRNVVKSCVNGATDARRQDANIDLTSASMWPWHLHGNLGVLNPVGPNPANPWNDVFAGIVGQLNPFWYKLTNRFAIEIVDTIEKKLGRMRGHVVVEFQTTPDFWSREYKCTGCNRRWHYCTKDGTTLTHQNAACPNGCGGRLQSTGMTQQYPQMLPVPSLGDPLGVSYNFDGTARLWTHELSHNRYYEHAANAPGAADAQHDHVNNPDATVSADTFARPAAPAGDGTNASRQWDRCCTMTYVTHLTSYDAAKDMAFFCFKCVLKNRGWKLAGVNNPPAATTEP